MISDISQYRIGNYATYEGKVVMLKKAALENQKYLYPLTLCEHHLRLIGKLPFMHELNSRTYCFDVTEDEGLYVHCHNWKGIKIVWMGEEVTGITKIHEVQNFIEDKIIDVFDLVKAL